MIATCKVIQNASRFYNIGKNSETENMKQATIIKNYCKIYIIILIQSVIFFFTASTNFFILSVNSLLGMYVIFPTDYESTRLWKL